MQQTDTSKKYYISILFLLFLSVNYVLLGQTPLPYKNSNAENMLEQIEKFNQFGTVLYFAAHPDDENTRLITWFSKEKGYRTVYQSLTRGDGGQNLIGTEKGTDLGVLRTHELLEARKIDGGEQFFSRAYDFGFSKNPEETFRFWPKDELMADVVYLIRKIRPDVIVNRFPPTPRAGHGHHSASAMLSIEAFDLAADPNAYPEQLSEVEPWQATSLYLNTSSWWEPNLDPQWHSDTLIAVNIGEYSPKYGKNYTEIAALSRSMHRCQGFGSLQYRGEAFDFMRFVKGQKDINLIPTNLQGWQRINAPKRIVKLAENLGNRYVTNLNNPAAIIPDIKTLHTWLSGQDNFWAKRKKVELEDILFYLCGLKIEALTTDNLLLAGSEQTVTLEAVNRSSATVSVEIVQPQKTKNLTLPFNQTAKETFTIQIPEEAYNKFWLSVQPNGFFATENPAEAVSPENFSPIPVQLRININGITFSKTIPLVYKYVDPAFGERIVTAVPAPPVFFTNSAPQVIASPEGVIELTFGIRAIQDITFTPGIQLPPDWQLLEAMPKMQLKKGQANNVIYRFTTSKMQGNFTVEPFLETDASQINLIEKSLKYEHIPYQHWFEPFGQKVLNIDLPNPRKKQIAYIKGAGDLVPDILVKMGYQVQFFENSIPDNLAQFDVVIAGVRAINTNENLRAKMEAIHQFVAQGGNFILQYNTNRGITSDMLVPESLTLNLGRERVTEEDAEAFLLNKNHPFFNSPNQIVQEDFNGWVQERGLYFAQSWSAEFTPLISWNDTGETPKEGALVIAPYGKGKIIYTGISFFRQLPAGVPGAVKMFQNLIELE
ncbi:MAG: PIG-L family deacetylase [Luteibaculaceae bacterium]